MKTKELLADSFRSLVLTMPFQKISIKMISMEFQTALRFCIFLHCLRWRMKDIVCW